MWYIRMRVVSLSSLLFMDFRLEYVYFCSLIEEFITYKKVKEKKAGKSPFMRNFDKNEDVFLWLQAIFY